MTDSKCICEGNWRLLVEEYEHLFDRKYKDDNGNPWTFFGLVHGSDDYYYGMYRSGDIQLLSCVGSPEGYGWELID